MKIPTTADLAEILNSIMGKAELIMTVTNNLAVVVRESKLYDKAVVKDIKSALNNTRDIIDLLSNSLSDIYLSIYEADATVKSLSASITLGDPRAMISFMKTGNLKELNLESSIFDKYVQLLSVVSTISTLSTKVDKKAIKNSQKSIIACIEAIAKIYKKAVFQLVSSGFAKLAQKTGALDLTKNAFDGIVGLLTDMLKSISALVKENSIEAKDIRRAVRNVFRIFDSFLFRSFMLSLKIKIFGLGRILKSFGEFYVFAIALHNIFDQLDIVIKAISTIGNSKVNFLLGLAAFQKMWKSLLKTFDFNSYSTTLVTLLAGLALADKVIVPLLQSIMVKLQPVVDLIIELGKNFVYAKAGINALYGIFVSRLPKQRTVLNAFSRLGLLDIINLGYGIVISKELQKICLNLKPVADLLILLGKNFTKVKLGIRVVNRIFNGNLFHKSLVGVFNKISVKTYINLLRALPATILLSALMASLMVTFNSLIIAGKHWIRIRIGIRTTKYVIKQMSSILDEINKRISPVQTLKAAFNIFLLSTVLVPLTTMLILLGSVWVFSIGAIATIISINIILVLLSRTFKFIAKSSKDITRSSAIIAIIMTSILSFAGAFAIIMDMTLNIPLCLLFIGLFTLTVITCVILSKLAIGISILGTLKLLILVGPLLVVALALQVISGLEIDKGAIGVFCVGLLSILGVSLLIGLASPLLALSVIGASFMMIISFALIGVAGALLLLSIIPLDSLEKAKENALKVFAVCNDIIYGFVSGSIPEEKKSDNGFLRLLQYIGGPIALVAESLFAMAYVIFMFVAISIVLILALELKAIEHINLDQTKIQANVSSIFNSIDAISEALAINRDKKSERNAERESKFKQFLRNVPLVGNAIDIIDAISEIGSVLQSMVIVGCVTLIAKNLEYLQDIKIDNAKVSSAVDSVMQTVGVVSERIAANKEVLNEENINSFASLSHEMSDLAESVLKFNKLDENKLTTATDNVVKLIDKTNTVNVDKIKSIRDMFEQMARFSESIKGDFDKLADVLSDKLVDILEKLHTTIEDMSNKPLAVPQQAQMLPAQNGTTQSSQQNTKPAHVDTESLENIESILTEMSMFVKEIKENTETTSF